MSDRKVTIDLDEYNALVDNARMLDAAIKERKCVTVGSDLRGGYVNYYTVDMELIMDKLESDYQDRLDRVSERYERCVEDRDRYQSWYNKSIGEVIGVTKQLNDIRKVFAEYTEASIWLRIKRVFDRQA